MSKMERKPNASAGKGGRYMPGETGERFGQPNTVGPGAGISRWAMVDSQPHGSARGGTQAAMDKATRVRPAKKKMREKPAGNALPMGPKGVRIR